MKQTAAFLVGLGSLLAGCSSGIHVTHLSSDAVVTGVPWNLAMTQYTITITRQVTSCDGYLNGNVTVTAVPGKKIDEEQRYALRSKGVWATADITSTLASDGTSLGLNAHSEDQTATVISNTVGILAAVAKAGVAAAAVQPFDCKPEVDAAIVELKPAKGDSLKKQVDQATRSLATATARVAQLTSLYQGPAKPDDKAPLADAVNDLIAKQQTLDDLQAKLAADLKIVTSVQTVQWPPSASISRTAEPFTLSQEVAQSWVKWPPEATAKSIPLDNFDVWLALYRWDNAGRWNPPPRPSSGDVRVGVPVRLPRTGRLIACTKEACPPALEAGWAPSDSQTLLIAPDGPVLQLGQLYNVPLTGGTFKSEGAIIALDAAGVPTSIEVSEKQAAAAAATGSIKDAAGALADLPSQIAAARLAKTQAETAQVNANNTLAAARAATAYAGNTAAAQSQAAYLNATAGLATAEANAAAAGEVGQLAAQTSIAKQQAQLADQLSQLSMSQANLSVAPAVAMRAAETSVINAEATQINAEVTKAKAQALLGQ